MDANTQTPKIMESMEIFESNCDSGRVISALEKI
jgi:hypothetical protein